jgi:hypothetical protein
MNFFGTSSFALALLLVAILGGSVAVGVAIGHRRKARGDSAAPVGVVQGALLGLVGLLLAFGLSMAVGRYETRRAFVVQEANSIGTTYLRAQLLMEPQRTKSLELLKTYTDEAIAMASEVPGSAPYSAAAHEVEQLQRDLWSLAGEAVATDSVGSAPKLYLETLNDTIDLHTYRTASLGNRVPAPVMMLELIGSALALGTMALYLTMLGRGIVTSLVTAAVLLIILFVTFDLDRPQRGFITVPNSPLVDERASMDDPPAAQGPG